jgi:hypothetical protein
MAVFARDVAIRKYRLKGCTYQLPFTINPRGG